MGLPIIVLIGSTRFNSISNDSCVPDALCRFQGDSLIIDKWFETVLLQKFQLVERSAIIILTNALYYKFFECWAISNSIPIGNIINSGKTIGDIRSDLSSIIAALKKAKKLDRNRDVLFVGIDLLLRTTDSMELSDFFLADTSKFRIAVCDLPYVSDEASMKLAVNEDLTVASTLVPNELSGSCPLPLFRVPASLVSSITFSSKAYIANCTNCSNKDTEYFIPFERILDIILSLNEKVYVSNLSSTVVVDSTVSLRPGPYCLLQPSHGPTRTIKTKVHARVGLLGNPSDGYKGKTLSVSIQNFFASVELFPASPSDSSIVLLPHPLFDPVKFTSIKQLSVISKREGYSGGIRLLMAALHRFYEQCEKNSVQLPSRGFSVRYHTTIPRQVGLAGSSAILTSFLRAVMIFYGMWSVDGTVPTEEEVSLAEKVGLGPRDFPAFVLEIETQELGIVAGLQDRVVQSFEGCVFMDFTDRGTGINSLTQANESHESKLVSSLYKSKRSLIRGKGGDFYIRAASGLPPLFLAYCADPSDSGKIHSPVRQRWEQGDPIVISAMSHFASLAASANDLIQSLPYDKCDAKSKREVAHKWAELFASNFDTRRRLFGDAALGKDNITMVNISRECGCSAKLPGSGGAVVGVIDIEGIMEKGLLTDDEVASIRSGVSDGLEQASRILREAYEDADYVYVRLHPYDSQVLPGGRLFEVS